MCMGVISKTLRILRAKTNNLLNRARDPEEEIEYEYEQMKDDVSQMEEAIVDINTQRKIHQGRVDDLQEDVQELNKKAKLAAQQDREDLARKALEKKKDALEEIEEEEQKASDLLETRKNMEEKLETLRKRMEEAKDQKETLKSRHRAAEAQKDAAEALSSVGGGNNFNQAAEQLEEEYKEKEAHADSVEELDEEGVLKGEPEDEFSELEDLTQDAEVESELQQLMDEYNEEEEAQDETEEAVEAEVETEETEKVEDENR